VSPRKINKINHNKHKHQETNDTKKWGLIGLTANLLWWNKEGGAPSFDPAHPMKISDDVLNFFSQRDCTVMISLPENIWHG